MADDPADNNVILLYGDPAFNEKQATSVAITPGMLLQVTSGDLYEANSTAADTAAAPIFALQDELRGGEITDDYAVDAILTAITISQGHRVLAIANAAVAIGEFVESAGNGKLRVRTTGKANLRAISAAAGLDDRFGVEAV